jgi:hypothetical protein
VTLERQEASGDSTERPSAEATGERTWISALGAVVFFVALTLAVFRELLPRLYGAAPYGPDVLIYLWNPWWVHQALLVEHISPFWTSWTGWPSGVNLILHTIALSAVAPWVWLMEWHSGPDGVVLAHNAVVLSSFVLTAIGTYALAATVSGSRPAALIAAIPFAFSAHRLWIIGRTDLLSTQYLVFFVLLLLRTLRGGRLNAVGAGVLAAAVAYNTFTHAFFAALLGLGLLVAHPTSTARAWRRLGVVALVAGALAAPLLWTAARSLQEDEAGWHLTRERVPIEIVASEGADPRHFLLPSQMGGRLYELATGWLPGDFPELEKQRRISQRLGFGPGYVRTSLGYSLIALIVIGVFSPWVRRTGGRWLGLGLVFTVLALGPYLVIEAKADESVPLPYLLLRTIPGFGISKAPHRFLMPALLCFSVFAACTLARWLGPAGTPSRGRNLRRPLVAAALLAVVVLEYCRITPPLQPLPRSVVSQRLARDPDDYAVAYFPTLRGILNRERQMWDQVVHRKRLLTSCRARRVGLDHDPLRLPALRPMGENDSLEGKLRNLEALLQSPKHRIEFLVVLERQHRGGQIGLPALLEALEERYPVFARERGAASGLLEGFYTRTWFRIGGAQGVNDLPP